MNTAPGRTTKLAPPAPELEEPPPAGVREPRRPRPDSGAPGVETAHEQLSEVH